MKIIGITQQVNRIDQRSENRDALDQRWYLLAEALGVLLLPLPNTANSEQYTSNIRFSGFILSGGNDLQYDADFPKSELVQRDTQECRILDYAKHHRLPVVGVCRGMQMLNHYLGGSMRTVVGHAGARHGIQSTQQMPEWIAALPSTVNSYHDYGIADDNLAPSLIVVARAEDGSVEAAIHRELPWSAIMWHPEREQSNFGTHVALIQSLLLRG